MRISNKAKKIKVNRVKVRNKLFAELLKEDLTKLNRLCPALDEFRWCWEDGDYRSNPSFEVLCLYVLSLEEKVKYLQNELIRVYKV